MTEPGPTGVESLNKLLDFRLSDDDDRWAAAYPGDAVSRQPVHTCYVPADLVAADTPQQWGEAALALVDEHGPTPAAMAGVLWPSLGATVTEMSEVLPRVRLALATLPVEDLRIDLEDGYGLRPDAEEDAAALAAGRILGGWAGRTGAPLVSGVRIKSLWPTTRARAIRSLDLVLAAAAAAGGLPPGFVVTLPKVAAVTHVAAMVEMCEALEAGHGLSPGSIRLELQIEVPQAVIGADGSSPVPAMIVAAAGRCIGLHYGTYDFSAAMRVSGRFQALDHPLADAAKAVMQLAAAGTGVRVSDGSTNVMPQGSRAEVHAAWALHARLVRRQYERALYQGWDMHPGHLVTRHLTSHVMLRRELPVAAARLRAYLDRSATGTVDEPATAKALSSALVRAVDCGAVDVAEVSETSGLDMATIRLLTR